MTLDKVFRNMSVAMRAFLEAFKSGESGFPVWGKPKRKETEDEDNEQDQTKYWPMAYIFHSGQVERV
jgi:hypothetical protein